MISIVNTGVANISSVVYALERLGVGAHVTDLRSDIERSSHVIIPGVGTASAAMANLKQKGLAQWLPELKQPVLGICLGMQLLYEFSEEGNGPCLGVFKGRIKRLSPAKPLAIPHMGWNQVKRLKDSILLKNIPDSTHFYFVHSFRAPIDPSNLDTEVVAVCDYAEQVPAIIESKNWFGAQFHPERSGKAGEQLLQNFLGI